MFLKGPCRKRKNGAVCRGGGCCLRMQAVLTYQNASGMSAVPVGLRSRYNVPNMYTRCAHHVYMMYPICIHDVSDMYTQVRLGKVSIGKSVAARMEYGNVAQQAVRSVCDRKGGGSTPPVPTTRGVILHMDAKVGKYGFLVCPVCGGRTKTKVLAGTELRSFPLYCTHCKKQTVIDHLPSLDGTAKRARARA